MKYFLFVLVIGLSLDFIAYISMTKDLCKQNHSQAQIEAMQLKCDQPWYNNL